MREVAFGTTRLRVLRGLFILARKHAGCAPRALFLKQKLAHDVGLAALLGGVGPFLALFVKRRCWWFRRGRVQDPRAHDPGKPTRRIRRHGEALLDRAADLLAVFPLELHGTRAFPRPYEPRERVERRVEILIDDDGHENSLVNSGE